MKISANVNVDVEVEYTYHPALRGARDSLGGIRGAGPPLEPDEPEWFEIESACLPSGLDILSELSEGDVDELTEQARRDFESRKEANDEPDTTPEIPPDEMP